MMSMSGMVTENSLKECSALAQASSALRVQSSKGELFKHGEKNGTSTKKIHIDFKGIISKARTQQS